MKSLNHPLSVLDLFSGIGGFSLGLERAGLKTMAFCEIEPFCQKILKQHWPNIPVYSDIRELIADELPDRPDVVCGGYPCQPFSVAGKRRGKADHRHLWPEMFRVIKETKPRYVIAENVAGHVKMGLDDVLSDLESENYTPWPFVIPACALDARHRRDRIWIVAHANGQGEHVKPQYDEGEIMPVMGNAKHDGSLATTIRGKFKETVRGTPERQKPTLKSERAGRQPDHETMANTQSQRVQGYRAGWQQEPYTHVEQALSGCNGKREEPAYWETEPGICRVADGIPNRVDRIKALGNAVVPQIPQIPQILGEFIIQFHNETIKPLNH